MESILFKKLNEIKAKYYPEHTYFLLSEIKYIEQKGVFPGEGYFLPKYDILSVNEEYTLTHNDEGLNKEDLLLKKPLDLKPLANRKPLNNLFEQFELQLSTEEIGISCPEKPKMLDKRLGLRFRRFTQDERGLLRALEETSELEKLREEAENKGWYLVEESVDESVNPSVKNAYIYNAEECFLFKKNLEPQLQEICREWNNGEYKKAFDERNLWKNKLIDFPLSVDIRTIANHFDNIVGKFVVHGVDEEPPKYQSDLFGIPITSGKLLSKTEMGFVVSFNLEHLLLQRLLSGQIYSKNKQPLTGTTAPTHLSTIFQFPLLISSPEFALAQKESTVFVFFKTPKFMFSPNFRIVFWFQRSVIPALNDTDFIDTPDEYIPLVIALTERDILSAQGKPIPSDLDEQIRQGKELMQKSGNNQNYYVVDTFNLLPEDLEQLSIDFEKPKKNKNDESLESEIKDEIPLLFKESLDRLNKSIIDCKKKRYPPLKIKKQIGIMVSDTYINYFRKDFPEKIKFIREFSPFIKHDFKGWNIIKFLQNRL